MRLALLLPLLALSGCGQTYLRKEPTDTTPSISFCTSWAQLESHVSPERLAQMAQTHNQVDGCYNVQENAVYVLTADPDHLTVDESLVLMHELCHAADARFHANTWALLKAMGHNQHKPGTEAQ